VRTRISGPSLARLFQAGDVVALAIASLLASRVAHLPETMWLGAPALAIVLLLVGTQRLLTPWNKRRAA